MTVLRKFRDEFMESDPAMKSEVEEYYRIAPKICDAIDKRTNAADIYNSIWENRLKDAVVAVDNAENDKAHRIYKEMVLNLKDEYLQ